MRMVENGAENTSAPADYAELFQTYYKYVVALVRRLGIEDSRKEDVASEILLRFYERDFLAKFDPTMVFHYDGKDRPARFKSFLTKFVMTYVRGHLDKQHRLAGREVLLCDTPVGKSNSVSFERSPTDGDTWVSLFGEPTPGPETDVLDRLAEEDLIDFLRTHIAAIPRTSKVDTCDLLALFDEVVRQVRAQGRWNINELRQTFGIGVTAMHSWMWRLRTHLAAALGRPVPPKRPRVLRQVAA